MSFLNNIGGAGAAAGGFQPNSISSGFGHMIGADPSRVSMIADRIGKAANGIAQAGGAAPGYQAAEAPAPPANHMQLLDNAVLQKLVAQFGGQPGMRL